MEDLTPEDDEAPEDFLALFEDLREVCIDPVHQKALSKAYNALLSAYCETLDEIKARSKENSQKYFNYLLDN